MVKKLFAFADLCAPGRTLKERVAWQQALGGWHLIVPCQSVEAPWAKLIATTAAVLALTVAVMPMPANAGPAISAVRSAVAKGAAKPVQAASEMSFGKSAYGKPRDVVIKRSEHPEAAAHIDHAQKNGQPTVLHIDRAGAAERRAAATGTVNPKRKPTPGYERDEYPPAFTREGGSNANVRFIGPHDNRGAGSAMRAQTRNLPDGSKIRILVK